MSSSDKAIAIIAVAVFGSIAAAIAVGAYSYNQVAIECVKSGGEWGIHGDCKRDKPCP